MRLGPQDREHEWIVTSEESGLRLDRFLRGHLPDVPKAEILALLESGRVRCGDRIGRKGLRLAPGERVLLSGLEGRGKPILTPDPDVGLEIFYEDSALVAVNKPPGLPCHPLRAEERGTVANGLVVRYPEMGRLGLRPLEGGLVHRLDKDTSGVLLAARTVTAVEALRAQFSRREVEKVYLALVVGNPGRQGIVSSPIGSKGRRSERVVVTAEEEIPLRCRHVRPAETRFRLVRSYGDLFLVRLWMRTGVRHQLRAHMASIGCPVAGDRTYASASARPWPAGTPEPPRQMLHACELRLRHPDTGRPLRICAPLESGFSQYLRTLKNQGTAREDAEASRSFPVWKSAPTWMK